MEKDYQKYLRQLHTNGGRYESEIAFIEIHPTIHQKNFLQRIETYVTFKNGYDKFSGYYKTDYNFLQPGVRDWFVDKHKDFVQDAMSMIRYYAWIKIINDIMNPQLNGETMLFFFGNGINKKLVGNKGIYNNTFQISAKLTSGFPNYDNCHFTDNNYNIRNLLLNFDDVVVHPKLNIEVFQRSHKLKKIIKTIKLKQDEKERIS